MLTPKIKTFSFKDKIQDTERLIHHFAKPIMTYMGIVKYICDIFEENILEPNLFSCGSIMKKLMQQIHFYFLPSFSETQIQFFDKLNNLTN